MISFAIGIVIGIALVFLYRKYAASEEAKIQAEFSKLAGDVETKLKTFKSEL